MKQPAQKEEKGMLRLLRIACLLAALVYLVVGLLVSQVLDGDYVIPLAHRMVFVFGCVGLAALSFLFETVRRNMPLLTHALGFAAVLHVLFVALERGFDTAAVVAAFLVIPIMNLLFYRWKPMLYANSLLFLFIAATLVVSMPAFREVLLFVAPGAAVFGVSFWFSGQLYSAEAKSETSERMFEDLFSHSMDGIAIHELITDDNGEPADYVFLEVNSAFEEYTGLRGTEIVGRRVTEVLPGIEETTFIAVYGRVVLTGEPVKFEQFSEPLQRHYRVAAYSMGENRFVTVVEDISEGRELEEQLRGSRQLLDSVFQSIQDGISVLGNDLTIRHVNQAIETLYEEVAVFGGRKCYEVYSQRTAPCDVCPAVKAMQSKTTCFEILPLVKDHQRKGWLEVYAYPLINQPTGTVDGVVIFVRDITERMQAEKELHIKSHVLDQIHDRVTVIDLDGVIQYANLAEIDALGFTKEEVIGSPISIYGDKPGQGAVQTDVLLATLEQGGWRGEIVNKTKYGDEVVLDLKTQIITDEDGNRIALAGVSRDVSGHRQAMQEIEYLSFHDVLTGLHNRRFYERELQRLDVPEKLPLTLLIMDVNGLRLTNDAFGHEAGDKLLQAAADVLRKTLRRDELIARIGGDEFAVLLPNTGDKQAYGLKKRIHQAMNAESVEGLPLSVACGWAVKMNCSDDMHAVFKEAEEHMYRNKAAEQSSYRYQTIQLIVQTIQANSPRERQHAARVGELCRDIGTAMGLHESETDKLLLVGQLHDIGKIAISSEVLNNAASLIGLEREQIRRHPQAGYSILSAVNEYGPLADSVLAHHERWDGSGYPHGLKGKDIPIMARIIAVADTYDAMTSDRPYRSAMSHAHAMAEIRMCAGTQFDPDIVNLFTEMMETRNVDG